MNFNFSPYLPTDAKKRLENYQYHGSDKSLIYKYFWRPVCAKVVNWLPMTLPPNVITVSALLVVCLTHVWIGYYMPNLRVEEGGEEPPYYVFIAAAMGLFAYQLLDNLDGHQARRTGSSSPLGLLMDHGCDAFNCIIGSLSVAAAVSAGPSWKTWWTLMNTVIVFFMNTWEEYYRGALILPIINGPNEGILIAIGIHLTTAVVGPNWWATSHIVFPNDSLPAMIQRDSLTNVLLSIGQMLYLPAASVEHGVHSLMEHIFLQNDGSDLVIYANSIAVMFMTLSTLVTIAGNIYQVWTCVSSDETGGHGKYGSGWLLRKFPFAHALTRLIPLAVVSVLANVWFFISPDKIFSLHPRLFCWTVGLLYTKLAVHLMIAHLCSVEFHPFRRTLVPFFFFSAHIIFSYINTEKLPSFDEVVLLREFFVLSCVTFAHISINGAMEMATALEVDIFSIHRILERNGKLENKKKA